MRAIQITSLVSVLLLSWPMLGAAEIYKWKDKDGSVRYSDIPPPSNVQAKPIDKIKAHPPVEATTPAPSAETATKKKPVEQEAEDPGVEALRIRQQKAQVEKNKKLAEEEKAKTKAENCASAKVNYQTYKQGGRIAHVDEKGQKTYLGDQEINDGLAQAQTEINENCN